MRGTGRGTRQVARPGGRHWEEPVRRRWAIAGSLAAGLVLAGSGGLAAVAAPAAGAATVGGFTETGPLHTGRAHSAAALLKNGDVLVAGGENGSKAPLDTAELYDPASGTWSTTGSLPLAVSGATATRLGDGDVLVAGGLTSSGGKLVATNASELYDPSTGKWHATAQNLHTASFDANAVLLPSGKVLYAGGLTGVGASAGATAVAELYDPPAGTWSTTASLPLAVGSAAAAPVGSGAVVAGGVTGSGGLTDLAETYDAAKATWAPVDHLPVAVADATATALGDGDVLVAGGETSSGSPTASAARLDPSTGDWASVGSLPFASYGATATPLTTGAVLYAGGLTSASGAPTTHAALYQPSSGSWSQASDLHVPRAFAVAARLGDGDVLVAGGQSTSGTTRSAERFHLVTGTAPAFTSPPSVHVQAGVYQSVRLQATGTPTPQLHESGALPPGMSFRGGANGTAAIAGVAHPGARSSYTVTVTASNGVGQAAVQHLTLSFSVAPAFTSPATQRLVVGRYTTITVKATGTPTPRLSLRGRLPDGLRFRARRNGTATIYGVPRSGLSGSYHVTLVASNGVGKAAVQHLTLSFSVAPAFTSPAEMHVRDRRAVRLVLRASGSPVPHLALRGGRLPPGLSFHPGPHGKATITGRVRPGVKGTFRVEVVASNGVGRGAVQQLRITAKPVPPPPGRGRGYWYATNRGQVVFKGAARPITPRTPQYPKQIVDMATTSGGKGYYLVSRYGGVFNYGDAPFYGSIAHLHLHTRTVAIAVPPGGHGYYEVTRAGNVFTYGKARFYGSTAGRRVPPITAFALTPDGRGYWLVTARGNIFGFGDAHFYGSPAHLRLRDVTGLAPTPDGRGYWVVTQRGTVLAYGNAAVHGSLAHRRVPPVTSIVATKDGQGYWLVTRAGNVFNEGDARFFGSSAHRRLHGAVTGFAPLF